VVATLLRPGLAAAGAPAAGRAEHEPDAGVPDRRVHLRRDYRAGKAPPYPIQRGPRCAPPSRLPLSARRSSRARGAAVRPRARLPSTKEQAAQHHRRGALNPCTITLSPCRGRCAGAVVRRSACRNGGRAQLTPGRWAPAGAPRWRGPRTRGAEAGRACDRVWRAGLSSRARPLTGGRAPRRSSRRCGRRTWALTASSPTAT